jgi:hypothetical protein
LTRLNSFVGQSSRAFDSRFTIYVSRN